jgi:phosphonate transport system ATP-binding protein
MSQKKDPVYAVEFKNVASCYGRQRILENVDLTIPKGITQVIIGPSGAGKTTFLKILNGLMHTCAGSVSIFGSKLTKESVQKLRPKIGYVPQHMGLVKVLTARENVLLGALPRLGFWRSLFKMFPQEERDFADHLLNVVGLSAKKGFKTYCLSGGEKRRVAIARALMQKPDILLADEILSDLDMATTRLITQKIEALKKEFDLTVIMVEHDIFVAKECGDQIAVIRKGGLESNIDVHGKQGEELLALFR